jgi:hypothetical protein
VHGANHADAKQWSCGFTVARSDFRVRDATQADAPFSNSADTGASVRRASVTARRRRARQRPRPHDRFEDLRDAAGAYANSGPAQQRSLELDEAEQDADDAARRVNDLINGTRVGPR